jgi:hypothetical protein
MRTHPVRRAHRRHARGVSVRVLRGPAAPAPRRPRRSRRPARHLADHAVARRLERQLHLHRLDHQQSCPATTVTGGDLHHHHAAGHRRRTRSSPRRRRLGSAVDRRPAPGAGAARRRAPAPRGWRTARTRRPRAVEARREHRAVEHGAARPRPVARRMRDAVVAAAAVRHQQPRARHRRKASRRFPGVAQPPAIGERPGRTDRRSGGGVARLRLLAQQSRDAAANRSPPAIVPLRAGSSSSRWRSR